MSRGLFSNGTEHGFIFAASGAVWQCVCEQKPGLTFGRGWLRDRSGTAFRSGSCAWHKKRVFRFRSRPLRAFEFGDEPGAKRQRLDETYRDACGKSAMRSVRMKPPPVISAKQWTAAATPDSFTRHGSDPVIAPFRLSAQIGSTKGAGEEKGVSGT
jgi:hypothetical protein